MQLEYRVTQASEKSKSIPFIGRQLPLKLSKMVKKRFEILVLILILYPIFTFYCYFHIYHKSIYFINVSKKMLQNFINCWKNQKKKKFPDNFNGIYFKKLCNFHPKCDLYSRIFIGRKRSAFFSHIIHT